MSSSASETEAKTTVNEREQMSERTPSEKEASSPPPGHRGYQDIFRLVLLVFLAAYTVLNIASAALGLDALVIRQLMTGPISYRFVPTTGAAVWTVVLSSLAILVVATSLVWVVRCNRTGLGLLSLSTLLLALAFYLESHEPLLGLIQASSSMSVSLVAFVGSMGRLGSLSGGGSGASSFNSIKPI